jgi:G:T-mismatch repair DNA endonuclease (very short patch repair protein)
MLCPATLIWLAKTGRSQQRDLEAATTLMVSGWRVATIWESTLRGRGGIALAAFWTRYLTSCDPASTCDLSNEPGVDLRELTRC